VNPGAYVLRGRVQVDDAYLGRRTLWWQMPWSWTENKVPVVAARLCPMRRATPGYKLATVPTFLFAAIADWAQDSLAIAVK